MKPNVAMMALVPTWTGVEIRSLRNAKRLSLQEFAEYIGVSRRVVARWETRGTEAVPRPFNQRSLDICLERCSAAERGRFVMQLQATVGETGRRAQCVMIVQRCLLRTDMRKALAERDVATVFRILSKHGMSQREIAAMTGQSQSEISEIVAGRRVVAYDVLVRIADGLGIPRGHMGLAFDATTRSIAP